MSEHGEFEDDGHRGEEEEVGMEEIEEIDRADVRQNDAQGEGEQTRVVYEDQDLLVVWKPPGQGARMVEYGGTAVRPVLLIRRPIGGLVMLKKV